MSPASTRQSRGRWRPGQSGNPAGRKPGSPNRSTVERLIEEAGDVSPMKFLLGVLNDRRHGMRTRIEVARYLLPYTAPRLAMHKILMPEQQDQVVEVTLIGGGAVKKFRDGELISSEPINGHNAGPWRPHPNGGAE
jgi:hypothetical protein